MTSFSLATMSWSATTGPSNIDANELCRGLLFVDPCSPKPCLHHASVHVSMDTQGRPHASTPSTVLDPEPPCHGRDHAHRDHSADQDWVFLKHGCEQAKTMSWCPWTQPRHGRDQSRPSTTSTTPPTPSRRCRASPSRLGSDAAASAT
jgi:hypothetical protein